jgi:hypothetical protein
MIISRLNGGLGNQMFQYAFGRALSLKLGVELVLDTSLLDTVRRSVTPREFALDAFRIQARAATEAESRKCRRATWLGPLSRWSTGLTVLKESPASYPLSLRANQDNMVLAGYWQSETCFEVHSSRISEEFTPNRKLSKRSEAAAREIASNPSVAVHVRRGDYVSLPAAAQFHGTLPISYYEQAAQVIVGRLTHPLWVVFSDDVEWCRKALGFLEGHVKFIDHNQGADSWQDLQLMSLCQHHIIANSSFSWWGAWLSEQRGYAGQMIHAPKQWFNRNDAYAQFRIPRRWTRV